jgi:hypothetical protein
MSTTHSQLAEIIASFESAENRLVALARVSDPDDWTNRNNRESWSIAECVEHLNMTSRAYIPLIRDALSHDSTPPSRAFRRDLPGLLLSAMVGPLRKLGRTRLGRVKTTAEFEPRDPSGMHDSLAEFGKLQSTLIHLVRSSERHSISDIRIVSPFGGKMKYNVYSAFVILHRHQHRHLQQAEEVWQ